jgi:hypothetical protein
MTINDTYYAVVEEQNQTITIKSWPVTGGMLSTISLPDRGSLYHFFKLVESFLG